MAHTPLGSRCRAIRPRARCRGHTPQGPLQGHTPLGPLQGHTLIGPLNTPRWSSSTGTCYLRTSGTVTTVNVRAPEVRGAIELSPRELANTRTLLGIPEQVGFSRVTESRLQQLLK
ncbi:hypothetical protein MTO96_050167 [Rhipicephalus appendiculatus]